MLPALLLLLIAVPLVEIYVIVQVAHHIGILPTLVLLLAVSMGGAWLLKQQGMAVYRALQETLRRGEVPTRHLADGAMVAFGGALLLTPGFVTDAVGLLLLLPVTRMLLKGAVRGLLARWGMRRFVRADVARRIYSTRVTGVRSSSSSVTPAPDDPHAGRRLPRGGDGSPDRG